MSAHDERGWYSGMAGVYETIPRVEALRGPQIERTTSLLPCLFFLTRHDPKPLPGLIFSDQFPVVLEDDVR